MRYLFVLLVTLSACGAAPPASGPVPEPEPRVDGIWIETRLHEGWYGATLCGSRPTGWLRADVALSREGAQVATHEMDHVMRVAADGGCEAHRARWAADQWGVTLDMEAHAYCASARVWARQERIPLEAAIARFAERLSRYPLGLSVERATEEIAARCRT